MITGDALAALIGLTVGRPQHSDAGWLKYFIDGRVLYVAKRNFRHTLAWVHINIVNAVYGNRVVQIGDYQFKIGLLTGADTDPATYTTDGYNQPGTFQSEWTRLLYPTVTDAGMNPVYHKTGQVGENWAEYSQADLNLTSSSGYGRQSWCQETVSANAALRVNRGYGSVTYSAISPSSSTRSEYGWRPRLELITS